MSASLHVSIIHQTEISDAAKTAPENFHGGLSVGVVCRLEAQLLEAQPVEEHLQGADEVSQG